MIRSAAVLLAIGAALVWAPSAVFGTIPPMAPVEEPNPGVAAVDLVVLLGVILGLAAAALLGTGWLVVGRDHGDDEELAPKDGAVTVRRARDETTPDALGDDPVIAAMRLEAAPRRGPAGPTPWAARAAAEPTAAAPRRRRGRGD